MRFLADEGCDFAVVRGLRSDGHDVLAICELQERSIDREIIEMAYREGRILLTEDKDFGWLAYVAKVSNPGVVLIRFPAWARGSLATSVSALVAQFGSQLHGAFAVLRPGWVRISVARTKDE
jgi:predicted nuclease of predicted toxin-antitoxin system